MQACHQRVFSRHDPHRRGARLCHRSSFSHHDHRRRGARLYRHSSFSHHDRHRRGARLCHRSSFSHHDRRRRGARLYRHSSFAHHDHLRKDGDHHDHGLGHLYLFLGVLRWMPRLQEHQQDLQYHHPPSGGSKGHLPLRLLLLGEHPHQALLRRSPRGLLHRPLRNRLRPARPDPHPLLLQTLSRP